MMKTGRLQPWAAALLLLLSSLGLVAQTVTVELEPEVLKVGTAGRYTLSLRDLNVQSLPNLQAPVAKGLKVVNLQPGVSQRTSIINGRRSSQIDLSWQIIPLHTGTVTIPGQTLDIGGTTYTVPEKSLRVLPESEAERTRFRFVWDLPKKDFFVGEAIPAFLKAYVRNDLRAARPNPSWELGDGIIAKAAEEPNIVSEEINGVSYTVAVWPIILTPIRPDTFTLEATTSIAFEDPANPVYVNDLFRRRLAQDNKVLVTPPTKMTVREVPPEGRLPGFNGAIGDFSISAQTDLTTINAGEPLTLDIILQGTGNFERIAAPEIAGADGWRTYPPKVSFEAGDSLEYSGKKIFSYLLIPVDESIVETPAITFASFNAYSRTYKDLSVKPIPVTVKPAPEGTVSIGFTTPGGGFGSPASRPPNTWRPFKAELGTLSDGVRPIFQKTPFIALQLLFFLVFALWGGWKWRQRKFLQDEGFARRISASKAVRQSLKKAHDAATKGDTEGFYLAAQMTIREAMSRHLTRSQRTGSLTMMEIDAILDQQRVAPELKADVAGLFREAEAMRYAGNTGLAGSSLTDALAKLEKTIRALT